MGKGQITNQIRKLRFFKDEMTQKELADLAGVTRQTIIALEQSKYAPSLDLAFRVALALDENLEDVFSYEPEGQSL